MGWLPTEDRSGKLMTLGGFLALFGCLVAVGGNRVMPHGIARPAALALLIAGGVAGLAGLLASGVGQESQRQRLGLPVGRFYHRQVVGLWRSLPPPGRIAFGVILPITVITFSTLAWLSVSGPVMVLAVGPGLLAFAILLTIAGRSRPL
jgi:hypothetical protein